jgi:prophage regulatory protein
MRILKLSQVTEKVGIGRATIYRGVKEGWFPKQVKLTDRGVGWIESEVDAFIEKKAAERK